MNGLAQLLASLTGEIEIINGESQGVPIWAIFAGQIPERVDEPVGKGAFA